MQNEYVYGSTLYKLCTLYECFVRHAAIFYPICICPRHPRSGKRSGDSGQSCLTGIYPSVVLTEPPSLRDPASLQGCDWTGVSLSSSVIIAHCSCHLPFETRHSRSLRRGHGASFHMLTGFHSPKRKYLMNEYPLVKFHERKISPLTYRRFTRRNITPFTKTFLIFF